MAYFPTTAKTAAPSTKHGWPVPVNETGIVWTCHPVFPDTCDGCFNKYDADTNPTGDAGIIAHYCSLDAIAEDEGSDLGGQNPGILLATFRKLQRLLNYFFWLGAGVPAAESQHEGDNHTHFTERWRLYVTAGGSSTTVALSRNQAGCSDPLSLPCRYVGVTATNSLPIQPGDTLQAFGTGGSVDPNGASALVCAVTYVSSTTVSVRLTRPIYVANNSEVAGYGDRSQPPYFPYPVPSVLDEPNLCHNCRIDDTGSMTEICEGLGITDGYGTYAGTEWYCAELLDASRIADFEAGKCSVTTCSRYSAAAYWPPIPVVAWNALLASQNLCRVIPLTGANYTYWTRPTYGAPSLACLLGERAHNDFSISLIYPQVDWYGGVWGRMSGYQILQGIWRDDSNGALNTGTHRECFTGGLLADATMQDVTHRNRTEDQPTRRWPSLGCSSYSNLPGLWSGFYGWTSPSEFASQTVRKREKVFPGMQRSDTAGQGSFGTWAFHADAGKTLTSYNSKLTISVDAGRTFPTKHLSTTARTIAAVTEDSGNGVLRIELTPETVTLPYETLDEDKQPTVEYLTFLYAGNAVDPEDQYRIRSPYAGDSRNKTGDLYDKIQRGDTIRFESDETYAFTVLRAEAMYGSAASYSDTLLVDDVPVPGLPYLITDTVDAMTASQTHVEVEVDGGLPPSGYVTISSGDKTETIYYASKARGYGGTLLTGITRAASPEDFEPGSLVTWNKTGNRKKRDCIWVQWHGELGANEMAIPSSGDKVVVNTSSRFAPTKAWSDDGAGSTSWAATGYTLALRHREVDESTDETLTEDVDYLIDRASGRVEVLDSAIGIDNTALAGAIDNSQTTITVDDASGFPANGRIQIDDETVAYTGRSDTTFNGCTRGVVGGAASHGDGAVVRLADPSARTLSGDIDDDDTTITLDSDDGVPDYGCVQIDSEIIGYSGLSGNALTNCRRGARGTTAAAHSDSASVTVLQPWGETGQCLVADGYAFERSQYAGTSAGDIQAESLENLTDAVQQIDACFVQPATSLVRLQANGTCFYNTGGGILDVTTESAFWACAPDMTATLSATTAPSYQTGTLARWSNQPWKLEVSFEADLRGLELSGLGAWGRFPVDLLKNAYVDIRVLGVLTQTTTTLAWSQANGDEGCGESYDDVDCTLQAVVVGDDDSIRSVTGVSSTGAALANGEWHRVSILPVIEQISQVQYSNGDRIVLVLAGVGQPSGLPTEGFRSMAEAWTPTFGWDYDGQPDNLNIVSQQMTFTGEIQARNWRVQIDWDKINDGSVEIPEVVHWPGYLPAVVE